MNSSKAFNKIEVALIEDGTVLDIKLAGGKGSIVDTVMMDELGRALDDHRELAALRMVLLRGSERYFSFGASIDEHTKDKVGAMLPAFHGLVRKMVSYPVPLAGLVQGRCMGGAFELVLACHFVLATDNAIFSCPEIKLGVFPPVLAVLGPNRLGAATTERLVLTGGELDAAGAERIGWLTRKVEGDDAPAAAMAWYRDTLAPLSAFSLRQATRVGREHNGMLKAVGAPLEAAEKQYLSELALSHDGNEGIEAFIARRKPVWSND